MPKRGKRYEDAKKQVDSSTLYEAGPALELVKNLAKAKFDETIEIAFKLNVDPRHADQQVRGAVVLPHGTGKTRSVLAVSYTHLDVYKRQFRSRCNCRPGAAASLLRQPLTGLPRSAAGNGWG